MYSQNLHLQKLAMGRGTAQSVPLICVCMGKHMPDLKGVFENAFVVLLFWKLEDQGNVGLKQWNNVLGLIVQNTRG